MTAQWKSEGSSQTNLAAECAPPPLVSPLPPLIAIAIGFYVAYAAFTEYRYWTGVLIGVVLIALGVLLAKNWIKKSIEYSDAKQAWQNTWLCQSCGASFIAG